MSNYVRDDGTIGEIVSCMLLKYHQSLHDADVRIDVLLAHAKVDKNDDPVGPALKHGGYQCAATVKVLPLRERVKDAGDAEIIVDGDRWDEWTPEQKDALIDHELEHLEIVVDKDGVLKRDDANRPMLKTRRHDRQFGWFDSIARRHGRNSFEVFQAESLIEYELRQLYLPGFNIARIDGESLPARPSENPQIELTLTAGGRSVKTTPEELEKVAGHVRNIRKGGGSRKAAARS